ncbi:MAG: hypothetical protein M0011_15240 [Elusimicrobia bacterium]|nr:hypothetical protein [Elusimicrobiota bacterium]
MQKKEQLPHMCDMAGKKDKWKELKEAAAGARWICSACGRAAAEKERLCVPVSFGKEAADGRAAPDCCGH